MELWVMLLAMGVMCAGCAAVSAVMLAASLEKRGIGTPWPLVGLLVFRNLGKYREVTLAESGKAGMWWWMYVVPINAALLLVVVALIILI